jgi:uncharacterized repeat protein (TIGR01451 family)
VSGFFSTIQVTSSKDTVVTIGAVSSVTLVKKAITVDDFVGGLIQYSITVTNTGNQQLHDIVVTDELLDLHETIAQLAPAVYIQIIGNYELTTDDLKRGSVTNTAIVNGYDAHNKQVSNEYTLGTAIYVTYPSVKIFKTVTSVGRTVGSPIHYTLTVTNNGNVPLHNVNVKDYLLGINVTTSLQPHQVYIKNGSYTLKISDFNRQHVTNTAYVTGLTPTSREVADESTLVTPLMVDQSAVFLSKTATSADDVVGGTITYKLTIVNNGNSILHQITLSDAKLNLNKMLEGTLNPGMTYTELHNYTVTEEDFDAHLVTNTAHTTALDPTDTMVSMTVKLETVPCVVKDTMIAMQDGTQKPIQSIVRGDIISSGLVVARLCETKIPTATVNDIMIFKPNSLGFGCPQKELTITDNHPIIYNGARRPARCFMDFIGVTHMKRNDIPILYDIQFEHDGTYIANGVVIQSCSPCSTLNPLPKELYFDQSLYSEEIVWDNYNQSMRLLTDKLKPIPGPHTNNKRKNNFARVAKN